MIFNNSFFLILLVLSFVGATNFWFISAYGHGEGGEKFPPVLIGNRNATLDISTFQSTNGSNSDKEIFIQIYDTSTLERLSNVMFEIEVSKGNHILFNHTFNRENGKLVILTHYQSGNVTIQDERGELEKLFQSLFGPDNGVALVSGPFFDTNGLYDFKIKILTVDSFQNKLEPPIKYDAPISFRDTTEYEIRDTNYGAQKILVTTYYDLIDKFHYEPESKSIEFTMPFEWSEKNLNQTVFIVHEEVHIPKTFGDLISTRYIGYLNNLPIPENSISIDDYSSEYDRIVHIVLNKGQLSNFMNIIDKNSTQIMEFRLESSNENKFPITVLTENIQYKVNLSWEPEQIVQGSKVKFIFDIQDAFSINKEPIALDYDFSIGADEYEIHREHGFANNQKSGKNEIEIFIPQDYFGPVKIRFANLGGNVFATAEFIAVVDKIEQTSTFPLKLSSYSIKNMTKTDGSYVVDLTWFPSQITTDEQTEFVFTIKDKKTDEPISQISYDFVILQDESEIFRKSGLAQAGGDYIDYTFSKNQQGSSVLRIENINGSDEFVEIPLVVTPEFPTQMILAILIISSIMILVLNKVFLKV